MKYTAILITSLLSCYFATGQKYFKYNEYQSYLKTPPYYRTEPLFEYEKFDTTGKAYAVYIYDYKNLRSSLEYAIESVLSSDSINLLAKNKYKDRAVSYITITVDYTGKIYDITFDIIESDRKILTDDILYKIYQTVKKIKIDMQNVDINIIGKYVPKEETYNMHSLPIYHWPENN